MPFISIVIPVYNAEEYIEGCLSSVISQSFDDWEVILVDDGSTDSSPQLCDDLAARDSRIHVIHQDNGGTSVARNAGVAAAVGTYVTFIDNDDWWIDSTCLQEVVEQLRRRPVDLLWHMSCRADVDGAVITETEPTDVAARVAALPVDAGIRFIVSHGLTTSAVWTKIVRRTLLAEHSIVFPSGMRNEDTEWSAKVLACCSSVGWFDRRFYVYRMGHPYAQTSHRLTESSVNDLERILTGNLTLADSLPAPRRDALQAFLAYPLIVWAGQASALGLLSRPSPQRRALLARMGTVCSRAGSREARLTALVCRVAGGRMAARLLGVAFRKKHPDHSGART